MKKGQKQGSIRGKLSAVYMTFIIGLILVFTSVGMKVITDGMTGVEEKMISAKLMKDMSYVNQLITYRFGNLALQQGELVSEKGEALNGASEWIDTVQAADKGVMTIFVKREDAFERIATNVKNDKGERIVGTTIDKGTPVYEKVVKDEAYIGDVQVLGEKYKSVYMSLKDTNGEIIGMAFVGMHLGDVKEIIAGKKEMAFLIFAILAIICLVLTIACTLFIAKRLSKPIEEAVAYTETLSSLHLNKDVPAVVMNQNNEIGQLGKGLQILREELRTVIEAANRLSTEVTNTSDDLRRMTDYVNQATAEVSQVVEQIAGGATHQAGNTQDGAMGVEQLGKLVEETKDQIGRLEEATMEVMTLKSEGEVLIDKLTKKSSETQIEVEESYGSILQAKSRADVISNASEKIKEIASQTNLLALNASIEAARTGEEGKGFVVIAKEIRKLSEQSDKFNLEIEDSIKALAEASELSVEKMQRTLHNIEKQTKSVEATRLKFQGIAGAIENTQTLLKQVLAKQQVMSSHSNNMIDIMQTLSAIAEENAAATEEVASSIKEQTESIAKMNAIAIELANVSVHMKDEVKKFDL